MYLQENQIEFQHNKISENKKKKKPMTNLKIYVICIERNWKCEQFLVENGCTHSKWGERV